MLASRLDTLIDEQALHSQDPEDRYSTNGVSWQQYETLLVKLGDSPGCRVTYLDGVLEIVAPSLRHEGVKSRIGDLLLLYFLETDTAYYPKGSTTFRQQERGGGRRLTKVTVLALTRHCQTWRLRWSSPVAASTGWRSTIVCKCQRCGSGTTSVFLSTACGKRHP